MNSQEKLLKSARNLAPEAMRGKQGIAVMKPKVEIREPRPSDARALNLYVRSIFATSKHLITRAEEYRTRPFKQRMWISKKHTNPVEICLLAVIDGEIVGMLDNWTDRRQRVAHVTCFAMSVAEGWRGNGIGRALLTRFIDWVHAHPSLIRVELHVHSDNEAAIKLYESCGFKREGVRRNAVKYEDGRIVDDILMALWPNEIS